MFVFTLVIQAVRFKTTHIILLLLIPSHQIAVLDPIPSDCCARPHPIRLLCSTPSHQIAALDLSCFNLQGVVFYLCYPKIFLEIGYPIKFSYMVSIFRTLAIGVYHIPLFLKFQDSDFLCVLCFDQNIFQYTCTRFFFSMFMIS
jgi:hypothetical protein